MFKIPLRPAKDIVLSNSIIRQKITLDPKERVLEPIN